MIKYLTKFFSLPRCCLKVGLTGLLLMTGIFCVGEAKPIPNNELHAQAKSQDGQTKALGKGTVTPLKGKLPEVDGIYLYGQSPEPQQLGQEYMVFEVRQGKVVGAFYLPSSEFSCFYGNMQSGKLALTVASSPDSDASSDSIAVDQNSQRVATANDNSHIGNNYNSVAYPYSVALQNYYQLATVSASDRQILRTCKNNNHE